MYAARKAMMASADAAAFTPLDLFAGGENGFWYDLSDLSTLWQDIGATSPITADGQLIARIDDKSGHSFNATQSVSGSRPTFKDVSGVRFSEHVSDHLSVGGSISTLAFLHKDGGTGIAILLRAGNVANPDAVYGLIGNNAGTAANVGITIFSDDRSSQAINDGARLTVTSNNFPDFVYSHVSTDNVLPSNADHSLYSNTPSGGPMDIRVDNASVGTQAKDQAIDTGNATFDMNIAAAGNSVVPLTGRIYQMIARDAEFTSGELSNIETFFAGKL
jgi:hypothetical protein